MNFKKLAVGIVALVAMVAPLAVAPSASAAVTPKATITKIKLDKKGRPAVKVKANVKTAVLIAPPRSDGEPVNQRAGSKTYRIKVPISKGNSASWSVVVYNLQNGEILAHRDFNWYRWKKLANKCDRREPVVVVKSAKAKRVYVKMTNGKNVRLHLIAREGKESVFGGKRLPKKAKSMVTVSPGKPKVSCL